MVGARARTRDDGRARDIGNLTMEELVNMPFEELVGAVARWVAGCACRSACLSSSVCFRQRPGARVFDPMAML